MEKLLRQRRRLPKKGGVKTDDRYAMFCFGTRRIPEGSYRIQVTGAAALQPRSSFADPGGQAGSTGGTTPAAFRPGRRQYQ